jgi:hypothetical protein
MSRNKGTFNFAANFEGLLKAPIDARQMVCTYADLTLPATWSGSSGVWLYNGAIVSVATGVCKGIYWLCDENNYTSTCSWVSIPNASGLTGLYLKLDQTSGQTVSNGQPLFDEGIKLGTTPAASLISGHTTGRMYYDDAYQTVSIDTGTETTLQLGQEDVRYVYNASGSIIPNGAVIRAYGVQTGGPGTDVVSVCLAKADTSVCAAVLGIATQDIGISGYGFITQRGHINELNTSGSSSQYSGMTSGDDLYLSATVPGGVVNTPPAPPNVNIKIGGLITKHPTTGKIYVEIHPLTNLNDLGDVDAPSPSVDEVLKWNGVEWVNATVGTTSAGSGVNFYYATPIINNITQPVGLNSTGTLGNGVAVYSLSKTPVTLGGTQTVCGCINASGTYAAVAWLYNTPLGRPVIDAGTWDFTAWLCVDGAVNVTCVINNMYQVVPITGGTISITGASANARTATVTNNQFTGSYFTGTTVNTNASWLQTATGIYQICASINNNQVCIVVPTGYVNSGTTGNTWNKLFGVASPEIDATSFTCYVTTLAEPSFSIACTDKLGRMGFLSSTATHTVSVTYNGNTQASYIKTPLITLHNDLAGLQGGSGTQRYHLTQSGYTTVQNTSGVNTGDETKPSIESKLTGNITSHTHSIYSLTGHTHSYTGSTILDKPTFVGSGNTMVSQSGNTYIIYSSGGTEIYDLASPSICATGGMCIGTVLTGKTAIQILQEILVPELCGVLTPPSFSTTLVASTTYYEIGCSIPSLSVCGTFNRGCINPQYMSTSDKRVGYATCYVYTGAQVAGTYICSGCSISQTVTTYVLTAVPETWGITACYGAGVQPLGQNGTPFNTACPAGSLSDSKTICGVYPIFATTVAIGTLTKQALVAMTTSPVQLTLVAESGGLKDKFEIPNSWTGNPLKCICTYNTFSSAWEFEGGSGAASLTTWTPSVTSETLCCGSAPYCLYTYNGANRLTTTCIRLVF